MAISPKLETIKVTNDGLADELSRIGRELLDLSMRLRAGFDVPVEINYDRAPASCPQPCEHLSQQDARDQKVCDEHPCTCSSRSAAVSDPQRRNGE